MSLTEEFLLQKEYVSFLDEYVETRYPMEYAEFVKVTQSIVNHQVFEKLNSVENIRIYTEFQVWCVWDFMSILKSVQTQIFSNDILWLPPDNPSLGARFYELIATEETDNSPGGEEDERLSHFQSFVLAMKQMKGNTRQIERFLDELKSGNDLHSALNNVQAPQSVVDFLMLNHQLITEDPLNGVSLLSLTRENFLPAVFRSLMQFVSRKEDVGLFIWYHQRHIELDEKLHGPIADSIYKEFINTDERILTGLNASILSLKGRFALLQEIERNLK